LIRDGNLMSARGKRLAMGSAGIVLNVALYNYLMQMQYAIRSLLAADDEDEEELAAQELDKLLSLNGALTELGTGVVSLGASKYSGAGRQMLKAVGSILYNSTSDVKLRADIKSLVRNVSFQNPYEVPTGKYREREGMYRTVGEAIAPLQTAIENFTKLSRSWQDAEKAYDAYEAAKEATKEGKKIAPMNTDEEQAVIALSLVVNSLNVLAQFAGKALPSTTLNNLSTRYSVDHRVRMAKKYAAKFGKAGSESDKAVIKSEYEAWVNTQPSEDRAVLDRAVREAMKVRGADPWLLLLRQVKNPEDRAEAIYRSAKDMKREEQVKLKAEMEKVGGIWTKRVQEEYDRLAIEDEAKKNDAQ